MIGVEKLKGIETLLRALSALLGLFFLATGIGFLTLPEVVATGLFVEPARAVGVNSIRGDFGGLFMGMGIFCLLGAITRHRTLLMVPVVFLGLVLAGRLTGVLVDDLPLVALDSMAMELIFVILLSVTVAVSAQNRAVPEIPLRLRAFFNYRMLAGLGVFIILVVGIFGARKQIGTALMQGIARQFSEIDVVGDLPDGLHVALCGAGAPMPDAKRSGSCLFVIAGRFLFVVDAGPGSTRQMELMKLPLRDVRAVLLTHFHSDHIGSLGELMLKHWAGGGTRKPLDVYGPKGVETVVRGFNLAYRLDAGYRVAHHGPQITPPSGAGGVARPFEFKAGRHSRVIIDDGGVKVTAFRVDHRPADPAVAYRFDYKERSLVISGDTLLSEILRQHARGADLLFHEALQPRMARALSRINKASGRGNVARISSDILSYHTFPEEAARIASDAGVRRLVFYHILPPLPVAALDPAFMGEAEKYYRGPITIGVDGMLFSMPAGSSKVEKKWQF